MATQEMPELDVLSTPTPANLLSRSHSSLPVHNKAMPQKALDRLADASTLHDRLVQVEFD
jgi:hypothetical protein